MNTEWAIAELDKFITMTVMRNGSGDGFITTADYTAASDVDVTRQAPVVEKILDRAIPNWRTQVPDTSANNRWSRHREAALRARSGLVRLLPKRRTSVSAKNPQNRTYPGYPVGYRPRDLGVEQH